MVTGDGKLNKGPKNLQATAGERGLIPFIDDERVVGQANGRWL